MHANTDSMLDTIATLALQIAQSCPDCADAAAQIAQLTSDIRGARLDAGSLRDAVEAGTLDSDMSDAQVDATVQAVVRMGRDET